MAKTMEQAIKDASEIHQTLDPQTTAFISGWQTPVFKLDNKSKKCLNCGKTGYVRKACNFYNVICHSCNKHGYISHVCMSKPHPESTATPKVKATHCLNEEVLEKEVDHIDIPCLHIITLTFQS